MLRANNWTSSPHWTWGGNPIRFHVDESLRECQAICQMKVLYLISELYEGIRRAKRGKATFWPSKAKLLLFKQIEQFFWNSGVITFTSRQLFETKILRGCVTPYRFFLQKIFKKSTFFNFFCIFRISLMSWLEK